MEGGGGGVFNHLESVITNALKLALTYFDNTKESVLTVDASIKNLGAVIIQQVKLTSSIRSQNTNYLRE